MTREPTAEYIASTIAVAVLAVVGVWLPWVRKRPVDYADGEPIITREYIGGLETGLRNIDLLIILLVVAAVSIVVLARYRGWQPGGVLIITGSLILVLSVANFRSYTAVERYAVEAGLYLLIASGALFVLIGASTVVSRRITTVADESDNLRIE